MIERFIDAVVFDLDGLLVDSEPVQYAAWDAFVARYGRELSADQKRRMYGTRLVDSAALVSSELGLPIDAATVAAERDEIFFEMIPGRILAKSGALDILGWLQSRSISVALATSGHASYVDLALASAGIPRVFNAEVTGDQVERGKPDPETFLTAMQLLGSTPEATLVLEDSPQGVQAAVAAGAICFAIPDATMAQDADLSKAHRILPSLDAVIEAFRDYGLRFSNSSQG